MIRTAWFATVVVVSTAFYSGVAILGGRLRARRGWYDWVHRHWSRALLGAAGVRVRLEGAEHAPPGASRVFVANHQSVFDILALMACLPVSLRFVAKQELARIPVFGRACRAAGHVFIDRGDRSGSLAAMRAMGGRMERERLSLVLFPEGTRSTDGSLARFKRGSFVLAAEARRSIVPVAIDGGGRVLPPGGRRVRPGQIRVRLAPPIPMRELGEQEHQALPERVRGQVSDMLADLRDEARA